MRLRNVLLLLGWPIFLLAVGASQGGDGVVKQGSGSYTILLPKGAKTPPRTIYRTDNVKGKMPTNDWWSSVAWMKYSERHYPHPLAVEAGPGGLRICYPGAAITANKTGIFGGMPANTGEDLILGHSCRRNLLTARVDGFSDWFVAVRFQSGKRSLRVTYGHGSPFVYALYQGGDPRLTFAKPPVVWSGDPRTAVLGVSLNGKHYGLFGPKGSTWTGLDGKRFMNQANGKGYFSLAVLPEKERKDARPVYAVCLCTRHGHAGRSSPRPESQCGDHDLYVPHQGVRGRAKRDSVLRHPHQWRNRKEVAFLGEYPSVRGTMKLAWGTSFRTVMRFSGVRSRLADVQGRQRADVGRVPQGGSREEDAGGRRHVCGRKNAGPARRADPAGGTVPSARGGPGASRPDGPSVSKPGSPQPRQAESRKTAVCSTTTCALGCADRVSGELWFGPGTQ